MLSITKRAASFSKIYSEAAKVGIPGVFCYSDKVLREEKTRSSGLGLSTELCAIIDSRSNTMQNAVVLIKTES